MRRLIVINRLGAKVEIKASSDFVETADGKLQSELEDVEFPAKHIACGDRSTGQGCAEGRNRGEGISKGAALFGRSRSGPWGIRRKTASGLKKVGDVATCQTFMPELQRVVTVTRKLLDPNASLAVSGKSTACLKVAETLGGFPGVHETWIDGQGRMLRQTQSSPFGETEMVIAEREAALHAGGGPLSSEMFARRCCTPTSGCLGRDRWAAGRAIAAKRPEPRLARVRGGRPDGPVCGEIANSCSKCGRCRRLNPCGSAAQ